MGGSGSQTLVKSFGSAASLGLSIIAGHSLRAMAFDVDAASELAASAAKAFIENQMCRFPYTDVASMSYIPSQAPKP